MATDDLPSENSTPPVGPARGSADEDDSFAGTLELRSGTRTGDTIGPYK